MKVRAKVRIIYEKSKEYFKVIGFEDTAFADFFASKALKRCCDIRRRKATDVAPTSVKNVSQSDAITDFENRAVGTAFYNLVKIYFSFYSHNIPNKCHL